MVRIVMAPGAVWVTGGDKGSLVKTVIDGGNSAPGPVFDLIVTGP